MSRRPEVPLELELPLPSRKAVTALRAQVVAHLQRHRPAVGSPFLTDAELAAKARVSRSTVRRALDVLQREGWIDRRLGKGTFVGPRVEAPGAARRWSLEKETAVLRLGLVMCRSKHWHGDWYSQGVLEGLDEAAAHESVSLELLTAHAQDRQRFWRRLTTAEPDVLACIAPGPREGAVFAEAQRLSIPCLGVGKYSLSLGVPGIHEDDVTATSEAVQYLAERGHRRIGFVQFTAVSPYVFTRREGYIHGMQQAGLEHEENLVLWLPAHEGAEAVDRSSEWAQLLGHYLQRQQPTALVLGTGVVMRARAPLIREQGLRVPEDLSLITFDQTYEAYRSVLGERRPAVIHLPLEDYGRRVVELARALAAGETVPPATRLPCRFVPGDTVADRRRRT